MFYIQYFIIIISDLLALGLFTGVDVLSDIGMF